MQKAGKTGLPANNDMNNLNQGIITASFGQNSVIKGDIISTLPPSILSIAVTAFIILSFPIILHQ